MATAPKRRPAVQPDICMMFRGVGWAGLQHAKALAGEDPPRITYADGDLLLMTPSLTHEIYVTTFEALILAVGRSFRIRTRSLGAALWERPQSDVGKMPDASFYVASVAQVSNLGPLLDHG